MVQRASYKYQPYLYKLIKSTIDQAVSEFEGTFTYTGYSSDDTGTDFSTTYNPALHTFVGIRTSSVAISPIIASTFTGLWVPITGDYVYAGYASNSSGANFSTTYNSAIHSYQAIRTSDLIIDPVIVSTFTGLWIPMQKTYTYVGYADYDNGDGFTETFNENKLFFALLVTNTEIPTRIQSNFDGLWQLLKTKNLTYNYDNILIDPNGLGSYHSNTMGGAYDGPCAVYFKGTYERIYFVITEFYEDSNGDPIIGGKTTHRIGFVDLKNNIISNILEIPFARPQATDTHTVPAVMVTPTGHIIVAYEILTSDTGHNSNVDIWRSVNPEEIEDPLNPGTLNLAKVATITGYHSYPKLFSSSNGNLYIFTRRDNGADHRYATIIRSTNDGITWGSLAGVSNSYTDILNYDRGGGLDWYAYSYGVYGSSTYGINIMILANEGYTGTSPDGTSASSHMKTMYFIHSDDGITWTNAERFLAGTGGFSKNIVSSGALTYAEMNTNCLVDDVSTDVEIAFAVLCATLNEEDGTPYFLYYTVDRNVPLQDNCATLLNLTHYDLTTSTWIIEDILSVLELGSNTTYGQSFYGGALGTIKVYNENIIDIGINRPAIRYYNDPMKVTLTSTVDVLDGRKYMVIDTDPNHFGTGIVIGDYITAVENTFTLDANNTLEPLLSELVIFRTYDGGNNWSIVFEDKDPRHQGFNGPYMSNDDGSRGNYIAIFKPMVRPYDGSKAGDRADFKIIIGKRI